MGPSLSAAPPLRPAHKSSVHQEHQTPGIAEAIALHSGLVDVPLPGMTRRTSYNANLYTNFQTAEIMPRISEELGAQRGEGLFFSCAHNPVQTFNVFTR